MRSARNICFFLCLCILSLSLHAQKSSYSNIRKKRIPVNDTLLIDSISLGEFHIIGIPDSNYRIDPYRGMLYWIHRPAQDSVNIVYRTLPLNFNQTYQHKDRKQIDSNFVFSRFDLEKQQQSSNRFIDYKQLDMSGSYGRSISIGNNQDFVSNSNFNLQANGYLLDSIKLEASLTDNTIPFQPEGNTANLQEFDLISIRLSKHKRSLQVGDYNLNKPQSYFLNYSKRVQGLFFETEEKLGEKIINRTGLSASIAKGEFARNIFMGGEGNQGPYRLLGNNGEQLFVILAATEKVYVDNILQERGENADYVINYNTNEVTFMPRRPINQFSRIQVQFEYRTNYYLNSLIYAYNELSIGNKWLIRANLYSNQDAKNQSFQQELSTEQKQLLNAVGDSINQALYPNISRDSFSASKILYRIRDTTVAGVLYDSVYEYSTDPNLDLYTVGFAYTGKNKGNYIVSGSNANGRVYQWIAPQGSIPQGDYTAMTLLISPKKQQVLTLAGTFKIDSFKTLSLELAGSDKDPNTFSKQGKGEHQGMAAKLRYEEQRFLGKKDTLQQSDWTLNNKFHYEYVQGKFQAIAPFREVEFGRDWNVALSGRSPDENWTGLDGSLQHRQWGTVNYSLSYYGRGEDYKGLKKGIGYNINNNRTNSGFFLSRMDATDSSLQTSFTKPKLFAEYKLQHQLSSAIGASYYAEHNRSVRNNDSLDNSSFYFDIITAYWKSLNTKRMSWNAQYLRRRDHLPIGRNFVQQNHSDNYTLQMGFDDRKNHQINFTGSYRQLHNDYSGISNTAIEETLLGRLQYDGAIWNRALSWSLLYDFGTGQEQKRSYTYVQVPAGQGIYNWIDYNQDGVQQLNEFVVALYPDQKLFIKIFTPSDDYVKVNNVNFNQSFSFEPGNFFSPNSKGFWPKLLTKLSNQLSLQTNNKIFHSAGTSSFNPIWNDYADSNILSLNRAFNNTFYINRNSARWGIDYNYTDNKTTQLLSYGLSNNLNNQHLLKSRVAFSRTLTTSITVRSGQRNYFSGINDGSNYKLQLSALEPMLTWINRSQIRISASMRYEQRLNDLQYGGEKAAIQSAQVDAKLSKTNTGIIQLRFTYSHIRYDNSANNTAVDYVLLDGLQQGNNYLWYLNWQRRLGKGIELLLEYEGRKAGSQQIINTGRMSVKAVL